MIRKAKATSLMLVVILFISLIAACGNNNGESASSSETSSEGSGSSPSATNADTKEMYEVTMAMPFFGAIPQGIAEVETELNKITEEKINATVKLVPISIGAWEQQMNLMSSSGEKLDLFLSFGRGYNASVAAGKLLPLDDLLDKSGQDLKSQFDPVYLNSAKVGGKIYGVPVVQDFTTGVTTLVMRKDLVDKYQIDVSSIHSMNDADAVFETIKKNEPGITPLAVGLSVPLDMIADYDALGDSLGVLPGFDNGLKVENLYETQAYENYVKKIHSWFKAGYINKDAATNKTSTSDLVKSGKYFSYFIQGKPGGVEGEAKLTGHDLVSAQVGDTAYSTTSNVLVTLWSLSANSKNPERAVQFLNLLYSDPKVANLLLWGIEGKDYVKLSDSSFEFPSGDKQAAATYSYMEWLVGNPAITLEHKSTPGKWEQVKSSNANAVKSKALGFSFNSEPVKNEVTAINSVKEQYGRALESGTIDPDKKLEEFKAKLKAAGIEKVIAEKQKQLDAWASVNK